MAIATMTSTTGMTAALSMPALMLALRFSWLMLSKRLVFSSSRDRLWMTRTPETFSCRLALTTAIGLAHADERRGARSSARRHDRDQQRHDGEGDERQLQVEVQQERRSTRAMPTMSPTTVRKPLVSRSCSDVTSLVTRDMTRPTSLLS